MKKKETISDHELLVLIHKCIDIEELKELEIEKIVPGHGNIGGKELLTVMINYVEDIESVVVESIEKKESLEELKGKEMVKKYQNWWLGNFYSMNLEYLYEIKINE